MRRALALLACAAAAWAQHLPERPDGVVHFVADGARLLTADETARIDGIARTLLDDTGTPLVVATIPSMEHHGFPGIAVETFARLLFDTWGVGSEHRNRGILLLVSPGDRRARIELGAAWGRTRDADAQRIMDERIVPAFRKGDYGRGIVEGVRGLDSLARGKRAPPLTNPWTRYALYAGLLALAAGVTYSLATQGIDGWGYKVLLYGCLAVLSVLIYSVATVGRRRSSGGGAFGGGFSGGGGASGSW